MADSVAGVGAAPMEWPPAGYEDPIAGHPYPAHEVPTTHAAQAAAEGVVIEDGDYIEFFGEKFRLADRVGIMPLVFFGNASKKGLDSDDMEGLAALYSLIRSVIHRPPLYDENGQRRRDANGRALRDESEWNRFSELAEDELAEGDDIMEFVNRAMEIMSARPRKPREALSASSRPTSEKSKAVSSSPVIPPQVDGLVSVADLGR